MRGECAWHEAGGQGADWAESVLIYISEALEMKPYISEALEMKKEYGNLQVK